MGWYMSRTLFRPQVIEICAKDCDGGCVCDGCDGHPAICAAAGPGTRGTNFSAWNLTGEMLEIGQWWAGICLEPYFDLRSLRYVQMKQGEQKFRQFFCYWRTENETRGTNFSAIFLLLKDGSVGRQKFDKTDKSEWLEAKTEHCWSRYPGDSKKKTTCIFTVTGIERGNMIGTKWHKTLAENWMKLDKTKGG